LKLKVNATKMRVAIEGMLEPSLIDAVSPRLFGSVVAVEGQRLRIAGLGGFARLGDRLMIAAGRFSSVYAEVLGAEGREIIAYAFDSTSGISAGARADLKRAAAFARPSAAWLGHIVNWRGESEKAQPPAPGIRNMPLDARPPPAAVRRPIGERLSTGYAAFDTFLPICRGQRIGIFAGSGVGKSMLLTGLASQVNADVCVYALIGERGREVRALVDQARQHGFLDRTVIVASTSDEPSLAKREGARLAFAIAEYFRDEGKHALLIFDSLTRFAEAHREIALARGEPPSLYGFPPSTVGALAALVERSGPGAFEQGDITSIFSVLVAGSDMEEPVADMVRGLLDGHVVLDRGIAERGRFPAINIRRSVSRSLPTAANEDENALLLEARGLLAAYEDVELLVRSGLYAPGADARADRAISLWPELDAFVARSTKASTDDWFMELRRILGAAGVTTPA
jgi:flagellum-specific ATP synthase